MNSPLLIKNAQRTVPLNPRPLRHLTRALIQELLHIDEFDLCIYVVGRDRMQKLNEKHLHHRGCTDVITFDYGDPELRSNIRRSSNAPAPELHGEIFICAAEAVDQARQFRTKWESELVRYLIHGVLHLCGYDDQRPADRRRMKREEDRLLKQIGRLFPIKKLRIRSATATRSNQGRP